MQIAEWCNGNAFDLHSKVEGSIPSLATKTLEGPSGASSPLWGSPLFILLDADSSLYNKYLNTYPIIASYSIDLLF